jgi:hypothetical protein
MFETTSAERVLTVSILGTNGRTFQDIKQAGFGREWEPTLPKCLESTISNESPKVSDIAQECVRHL